jgi:hypothetical protein
MLRSHLLALAAATIAMLPGVALATSSDFLDSDDYSIGFDVGTQVLSTSLGVDAVDATVIYPGFAAGGDLPPIFFESTLHVELLKVGAESMISMGTPFTGTAGNDIWITDANDNLLLTADVLTASVTGGTFAIAPFAPVNSLTIGGFLRSQSDFVITGGSQADVFGGVGTHAHLAIVLNFANTRDFGSVFSSNFEIAGRAQINPIIVPEPGTFLLLTCGLTVLAWQRSKQH